MTVRSVTVRYAADVGSLIRDLDRASKANDHLGDSSDKAGKKIDKMAAAGAAVAVALGVGIAKFAEFDAAMSAVAANTGATSKELDSLRDAAVKAGADTQFSATQAAEGINELAKAGVETADILGGGLTGALSLAAAGQLEVKDAAEIAATAMTQFNLEGAEIGHVADLLASGANKAQGGVGDLGMALKQAGLVAESTGLSLEETTAGLTAFASAGLIGSDAGTSFKSMLQRLTPQSEEAANLMADLGISAYDAQGNFIGLANFAGNLQMALEDLTPEQRNSALATIFGSDAVRAANILYDQGAQGIRKWTDEVNQQGAASEMAAKLTDNLAGDLERLQGSLDTALIQTGSGANDVMREFVKMANGAVDAFGSIPGPVIAGTAAFGAFALAGRKVGRLADTAFKPATTQMGKFRQELALQRALAPQAAGGLQRLGAAATAASRSVGGLRGAMSGATGLLGGPWAAALMGATALLGGWAKANADAKADADALTDSIDAQTGAWTELSEKTVFEKITFDVSTDDLRNLESIGINIEGISKAILDGGPAYDNYLSQLDAIVKKGGATGQQASGLRNVLLRERDAAIEAYNAWLLKKDALGETGDASADAAGQMDTLTGAVEDEGDAAAAADTQNKDLENALGALGKKSEEAEEALGNLKDMVDLLSGGQLALRAAGRQTEQSLNDVKDKAEAYAKAVKEHGKNSKEARDASLDWRDAIDEVSSSTQEEIKQMLENGATQGQLKKKYDDGRAAIEEQLKKRGLHGKALKEEADKIIGTKDEFNLLLKEYAKLKSEYKTKITAETALARQALQSVNTAIAAINDKSVTITVYQVYKQLGFQASLSAQQARRNPDVFFGNAGGITAKAYASGGMDTYSPDIANGHLPHIAPAGSWRVFGEPETRGESYIPLANDWRRPRAKVIASETVRRLGGNVRWNAMGDISGGAWGGPTDYDKMAKAFSKLVMPNLHIVSGPDAAMAAKEGVREFIYQRDNG